MTIKTKLIKDEVEISIKDDANHLGVDFKVNQGEFTTDAGREKILNFIAEYVSTNYECLHKKNDRGVSYLK